jgi:hypothetical protein
MFRKIVALTVLLFGALSITQVFTPASAADEISIYLTAANTEGIPGQELVFTATARGMTCTLSAFRLELNYDESRLEYQGLIPSEGVGNDNYRAREEAGKIIVVFLAEKNGIVVNKDASLVSFRFTVREDAPTGLAELNLVGDGFADESVHEIPVDGEDAVSANILPKPTYSCRLRALEADHGTLEPHFRPDLYSYHISVPAEVKTIEFFAAAQDPEATVRVSRKTLEKAGSDTLIRITVTASQGGSRQVYEVTVSRAARASSTSGNLSGTASRSGKTPSASSKSTGTTSREVSEASHFNGISERESSYSVLEDSETSPKSGIILQENRFSPFLTGILLCAGGLLLAALLLIAGKRKKQKSTEDEGHNR